MDQECKKQFSVIFTKVRFKTDRKSFLLIEKSISEINLLFCISVKKRNEEYSNSKSFSFFYNQFKVQNHALYMY